MENNGNKSQLELFLTGHSTHAYEYLGSHFMDLAGRKGVVFRVWAPNAKSVSVVGDFNGWNQDANYMYRVLNTGVWETFVDGLAEYDNYKYCVETPWGDKTLKTDPYAFHCQTRPENASKVYDITGYEWGDADWYEFKKTHPHKNMPINIYEMNAGSWKKNDDGTFFTYRQLADTLVPYLKEMAYTHIEFMPLTEFPFDGSWGYQVTGYFAVTSRYGTPKDLMYFIDECHKAGIGVILDWVPAHFPKDAHGLARFDGTGCYEYEDWRIGEHKEWGTYIFNYDRYEVKSFLVSSANYWIEELHFDGIRVDAVASMLYLDYNRKDGEWLPNQYGGRENLVAVSFLQYLNTVMHTLHPDVLMIAEESTSWANVTGYPIKDFGLGFDYKWNMGWMNDTLSYIHEDPLWRNWHQDKLTFSLIYAFSEAFILPISHDEVVYGKGSLINKMPGSYEQKFQGMRGFLGYMMAHPGKKLMFMGSDIGQFDEWNANEQLQWNLLDYDLHKQLNHYIATLNKFYRDVPAMHENDYDWNGFRWLSLDDAQNSIIAFRRIALDGSEILVVCNFQPITRHNYRIAVPKYGIYKEVLNSDSFEFGGYGMTNDGDLMAEDIPNHDLDFSMEITIPALGAVYLTLKEELPVPEKPVEEPKEEEVKEEPKTEEAPQVKEEPKAEAKEEPKTEAKEESKEEPKTEAKEESKEEPKAEVKEEPKAEPKKAPAKKAPAEKAEEKPAEKKAPAKIVADKAEEKPEAKADKK